MYTAAAAVANVPHVAMSGEWAAWASGEACVDCSLADTVLYGGLFDGR